MLFFFARYGRKIKSCKSIEGRIQRSRKRGRFCTEKSIDIVFKNLIKFGKNGSYKVDTMDEDKKVIVFSENASFMHMGFFYPVYLTSENNVTKIEVGIQGKLREFKSVVQKNHEIFFTNIKVALLDTE